MAKERIERVVSFTNSKGQKVEMIMYHNFKFLKNIEGFSKFLEQNPQSQYSYSDYVNYVTKLEFIDNISTLRSDYIKKEKVYSEARNQLMTDDAEPFAIEVTGDLAPEFDDVEYMNTNGANYAHKKIEEYVEKQNALAEKISIINYVAKSAKISLSRKIEIEK